jgi:methyl-accepting chemotaxis protein
VLAEGGVVVRDVTDRVHQIAAAAEEQSSVSAEMARNLSSVTAALQNESTQITAVSEHARTLSQAMAAQLNLLTEWGHEVLLLEAVKCDHLMWKARLADALHGGMPMNETELKDHTQCRLGKWYLGKGKERFGNISAFQRMDSPHARVHALGREISQLVARGDYDQALAKFAEMDATSMELFQHIDQLAQTIQAGTRAA